MKSIEAVGKTVEEAVREALAQLRVDRDQVQVEVLDEGVRGILGLIGTKLARVRVTVKGSTPSIQTNPVDEAPAEEVEADNEAKADWAGSFLRELVGKMGVEAETEIAEIGEVIQLTVNGDNMGLLIGHRGQTLDALQYIVNLAASKAGYQGLKVVVDVEDYRLRRKKTLEQLAERLADKVQSRRRKAILDPMSPQERRIIHMYLKDDPKVCTYSEGNEPYRRVVIDLKK